MGCGWMNIKRYNPKERQEKPKAIKTPLIITPTQCQTSDSLEK